LTLAILASIIVSMKKIIKLSDNTVVVIENKAISIVQQLFSDKMVVVTNFDELKRIIKEGGE